MRDRLEGGEKERRCAMCAKLLDQDMPGPICPSCLERVQTEALGHAKKGGGDSERNLKRHGVSVAKPKPAPKRKGSKPR